MFFDFVFFLRWRMVRKALFSPPFNWILGSLQCHHCDAEIWPQQHSLPTAVAWFCLWSTSIIVLVLPFLFWENIKMCSIILKDVRDLESVCHQCNLIKKERWQLRLVIVCDFSVPVKDDFTLPRFGFLGVIRKKFFKSFSAWKCSAVFSLREIIAFKE